VVQICEKQVDTMVGEEHMEYQDHILSNNRFTAPNAKSVVEWQNGTPITQGPGKRQTFACAGAKRVSRGEDQQGRTKGLSNCTRKHLDKVFPSSNGIHGESERSV